MHKFMTHNSWLSLYFSLELNVSNKIYDPYKCVRLHVTDLSIISMTCDDGCVCKANSKSAANGTSGSSFAIVSFFCSNSRPLYH
uniref:Uncharacterized protein n=1 Tax=Rhizophora mucronata TaxID=61149 RepID=A0A2P2P9M5_RHIMU